jgi:succinate dehydrogenase/fumarate reductase cytochrome b subunit
MIESIVDIKKIVPAEIFLVIVGGYMLEVIVLLSMFLATLEHGGDPVEKYNLISSGTIIGMTIFSFSILLIYFIFNSIIKVVWPL